MCHANSVHKEKHPKNNYSAANTACNPLKPHEAGQSWHSSMVLTLFCHAALLALPTPSPPFFPVAQSQPGDDTEKLRDNFKYSISTSSLQSVVRIQNAGHIYICKKVWSAFRQAKQGYTHIYIYIFIINCKARAET